MVHMEEGPKIYVVVMVVVVVVVMMNAVSGQKVIMKWKKEDVAATSKPI